MQIEVMPVIVVPDMAPLIHLAAGGQLTLLHKFGRVIVMDVVAYEASWDLEKPFAVEVDEWIKRGQVTGSNQPVEVIETEIGKAYSLARRVEPSFKFRDAGERAIRDWLIDTLPEIDGAALVIYEDKCVPRLLQRENFKNVVVVATTRAVLAFAEERGLIVSAEDIWKSIVKQAKGASPSLTVHTV